MHSTDSSRRILAASICRKLQICAYAPGQYRQDPPKRLSKVSAGKLIPQQGFDRSPFGPALIAEDRCDFWLIFCNDFLFE
ncbi:hypothetical protein HMPREF1986_01668 [Oribacterium sp. oral taxon 078 str. F0263]|nr:hypothetical protein HMPREF1986_01668 [Oribacterium sp. oral taxon 078 str. F0263]